MSELLKVYILSSNIQTCFLYRSNLNFFKASAENVYAIKIKFGKNFESTAFGSISSKTLFEVPNGYIGVTRLLAEKLGLEENEEILVSKCFPASIENLFIFPVREEDYIILLSCKSIVENHLLNQVRVVSQGQILPLHVFNNVIVDVLIGKYKPSTECGRLEKFTELIIIHPKDKLSNIKIEENILKSKENRKLLVKNINKILVSELPKKEIEFDKKFFPLFSIKKQNYEKFVIWPLCLIPGDLPSKITNKYIMVTDVNNKNSFGSHSIKILCNVERSKKYFVNETANSNDSVKGNVLENNNDFKKNGEIQKTVRLYSYVISLNKYCNQHNNNRASCKNFSNNSSCGRKKKIAFCPSHILKYLDIYIGSKIKIERIQTDLCKHFLKQITQFRFKECDTPGLNCDLWNGLKCISRNALKNVLSNIKFNQRINLLVIGDIGTGKSYLLKNLIKNIANEFIFVKSICCKSLRGKKIEVLYNYLIENLIECCHHEPSVFVMDDLHCLTYVNDDENNFNKFYSDRVGELIKECIVLVQKQFNVSVIATACNLLQLGDMVTSHGPQLFQSISRIPEMTAPDQYFFLNNLIRSKGKTLANDQLGLHEIVACTRGYTVQDLTDLVEKGILKCIIRGENLSLNQEDFDFALSKTVPLLLRGVKQKQNVEIKWENIGGMAKAKQILMEIFLWPSKYPEILKSCPLRLQRGALLYGAPGTGKTILAGALANKCNFNFISVKGPEILSKYVGASEEGVRMLFIQAQKTQPCLLFFDEFDSLAPKRGHDSTGVTDRVVNQLLTQLDGVEALNGVWVLAATSRPDLLDPALLRPGRLDKMVFCDIPSQAERFDILSKLSQNSYKYEDVDFEEIAQTSEGYTGADLQAVLYNAHLLAIKENNTSLKNGIDLIKVTQQNIKIALAETKPSLSKSEKLKYAKIYENFFISRKKKANLNVFELSQKITLA